MIFFNNDYEYTIINESITVRNLEDFCKRNNILLNITDSSSRWAAFANWYGRMNRLTSLEAGSFSFMISLFFTGMGVSCATDAYFREENIESKCLGILKELKEQEDDELVVARLFFREVFNLYFRDIEDYAYKHVSLNFRVSDSAFVKFSGVPGKARSDKLNFLINFYYRNVGKE